VWPHVLLSGLLLTGPTSAETKPPTDPATLVLVPTSERNPDEEDDRLYEVTRFRQELTLDEPDLDGHPRTVLALRARWAGRIIQGLDFARSDSLVVVLSYVCSTPAVGAESPFACRTTALAVDPEGRLLGTVQGDYLGVEVHRSLPFFLLKHASCCGGPVASELFQADGTRVCAVAHAEEMRDWAAKDLFLCEGEAKPRSLKREVARE